jgi:ABC-type dipeptide/oligopeptide/nickel transport system permease subunit
MSTVPANMDTMADGPKFALVRIMRGALAGQHWTFVAGVVILAIILLVLVLAPVIAPYDPAAQRLLSRLAAPDAAHLLGTDQLGRDVLSRIIFGGHFAMLIAAITLTLSAVIGTVVGAVSARQGGLVDEATMRVIDLLISFPEVVVAIFVIAVAGTGYGPLILALTITGWTPFARMARALTLEINAKGYIQAAEVLGCTRSFIIFRHVIPNAVRPIAAITFLRFGHKLITVGGLSYLGLGVQPPQSDWGAMLSEAQAYVERAPWLVFAPGFAIFITALSVTWIGQGLELRAKRAQAAGGSTDET